MMAQSGRKYFPTSEKIKQKIFLTEAIPLCNNNCTIYYITSVHNNFNTVI